VRFLWEIEDERLLLEVGCEIADMSCDAVMKLDVRLL
jgi:hypothetical protein